MKSRIKRNVKANSSTVKKFPQRGLGVAQLERLRLQERWKKMTEIEHVQSQFQSIQFPFSIIAPNGASVAEFSSPVYAGFGESLSNSPHCNFPRIPIVNGGLLSSSISAGTRTMLSEPLQLDGYRIECHDAIFFISNGIYAVKDLSSNQNMPHVFDQHEACGKKKRLLAENLGFDRRNVMNSSDILVLGLNLGLYPSIDASFIDRIEEMEIHAVQRKGKYVGGREVLEYDFFPPKKNNNSNSTHELDQRGWQCCMPASPSSSPFLSLDCRVVPERLPMSTTNEKQEIFGYNERQFCMINFHMWLQN